jgi:signal transduction histidine kinase
MLAPLEELQQRIDQTLLPKQREHLDVDHRNALRLIKLVNTLLDFSHIEAGQMKATYEPTDLATFTAELRDLIVRLARSAVTN